MVLRFLVLFAMFWLFRAPCVAAEKISPDPKCDPAALALFDAALARIESRAAPLEKWQFHQTLTTRQFDDEDKMIARGTWKSIFRPGEKDPIEFTSESLEGTLTFFNKKDDEPKKDSKSSPSKADEKEEDPGNRVDSLAETVRKFGLRDRFIWTCLPDEKAGGEPAAVIVFTPRPDIPIKTKEQRFFSQIAGKMWISREDATVLKAEGRLLEPYRLFWIIAQLTKLTFRFEVEADPASRLLRKSTAEAETIVAFPFKTVRQKHDFEIERYEPRMPRK